FGCAPRPGTDPVRHRAPNGPGGSGVVGAPVYPTGGSHGGNGIGRVADRAARRLHHGKYHRRWRTGRRFSRTPPVGSSGPRSVRVEPVVAGAHLPRSLARPANQILSLDGVPCLG